MTWNCSWDRFTFRLPVIWVKGLLAKTFQFVVIPHTKNFVNHSLLGIKCHSCPDIRQGCLWLCACTNSHIHMWTSACCLHIVMCNLFDTVIVSLHFGCPKELSASVQEVWNSFISPFVFQGCLLLSVVFGTMLFFLLLCCKTWQFFYLSAY